MAPSLSKLKEYQSSLVCLSGLTVAAWIIIYGKSSNKKRLVLKIKYDKKNTLPSQMKEERKKLSHKSLLFYWKYMHDIYLLFL